RDRTVTGVQTCALPISPTRVFAIARTVFGDWKRGADPFVSKPVPPVPPLERNKGVITEQSVGSIVVMLKWEGPSAVKDAAATYRSEERRVGKDWRSRGV